MRIEGKEYRTIWFENNVVKIIDQTKLPHQFIIKDLKTVKDAINAIKIMEVRGAPLIGATAAYGLVLSIIENNDQSFLKKSAENLINSRPTAINLKWAVDRMINKLSGVNSDKILEIALKEAKEICEEDVKFCENIGLNGNLKANFIGRGGAWLDTGTIDDFYKTSAFVSSIENRQGLKIACLEEISLNNKWINKSNILNAIKFYGNCNYSNYLKKLIS